MYVSVTAGRVARASIVTASDAATDETELCF